MNGLNIGAHAQSPAGITRAMGSLTGLMGAQTQEEQEAWYKQLLTHMEEAQQGGFVPSPELICGQVTDRERRRPIISETRKMAADTLGAGDGIIKSIFEGVFAATDDKRFFYADGPLKSSVEGRVLAGLAFEWDVIIHNNFTRHAGNADPDAATEAAPTEELRIWTEEELAPLKRILNRATVSLFRNSSNEPGVDAHQLAYYGEGGELIPTSLLPWAYFAQKEAKIVVEPPSANTYADLVIPAAAPPRAAASVTVNAALTVHGLFVDVDMVPKNLRERMKKASGSK